MLNIIHNTKILDVSDFNSSGRLEDLFSADVLEQIDQFKNKEIDYLIIRGMPVSDNLPNTPLKIRNSHDLLELKVFMLIARSLGKISEKGVENTIRFNLEGEKTNTETWHSHFQYSSSVFYCLRGDSEAKTYFLSANEMMKTAESETQLLTKPLEYITGLPSFALIEKVSNRYIFSKHIFDRSELEKYIDDLDLPDVVKMLKKIIKNTLSTEAQQAVRYLINKLETATDWISYIPGDFVLVHESSVIRYSPGYAPTTSPENARWLLAVSVI